VLRCVARTSIICLGRLYDCSWLCQLGLAPPKLLVLCVAFPRFLRGLAQFIIFNSGLIMPTVTTEGLVGRKRESLGCRGSLASLTLLVFFAVGTTYAQQRYAARVPGTLDLVEYGEYGINALTLTLDPAFDYEMFFRVQLGTDPPYLQHDTTGLPTNNPKFAESLTLLRVMSGSEKYAQIDRKMLDRMVRNIGKDGLFCAPYSERRTWHEGVGHDYKKKFKRDFANVYGNSRRRLAMIAWYEKDKDPTWKPYMQKLTHALSSIAIVRDDYAYYPDSQIGEAFSYAKGLGWLRTEEPVVARTGAEGSMFM